MKSGNSAFLIAALIAGLLVAGAGPGAARADVQAYTFDYNDAFGNQFGLTLGWEFSITNPILVTALGYRDYQGNGLANSHDLGLYYASGPNSGTLVPGLSATISGAGDFEILGNQYNAPPLSYYGAFAYRDVVDQVLLPGTYRMAGTYATNAGGNDFWEVLGPTGNPDQVNYVPNVTMGHGYFNASPTLAYPNQFDNGTNIYAGPNFLFVLAPEPASVGVLVCGGVALLQRRRRSA